MEAKVTKQFDGKKFHYYFNGKFKRNSTKDYRYACVATTRIDKGACVEGYQFVISLGNKIDSTYNSMAHCYKHCDLSVVEIM